MTAFAGKVAFVTGGSRGMGEAVVRKFAAGGASVALTYKTQREKAEALVAEIVAAGGKALAFQADVVDEAAIKAAVAGAVDAFGKIDILVNCAGILGLRAVGDIDYAFYKDQFDTNVWGIIPVTQAALPHFPASGGRIVNISTQRMFTPGGGISIYAAAKAAVATLTHGMAIELGPRGITVNAVAPALTKTDMTAAVPEERRQRIAEATPLRRVAEADDIASAIVMLASDDARWITGRTILTDGGLTGA